MIKGIRINKSKIVHLYWEGADRTDCGAGGMSDISVNGGVPTDDAVTCKRCLKTIAAAREVSAMVEQLAAEVEQAHAEAIEENAARDAARRARETADAITSYQIRRAENMDRIREEDHAEALVIDAELVRALSALAGMMDRLHAEALAEDLERSSRPHWVADQSGTWRGKGGEAYTCDLPVKRGAPGHDGLCFDRVAGVQRPAPVLSRRQRRACRRALRATLRRQAPQMRAASRARRTQGVRA